MADGATSGFRRRTMMAYLEDADPRFTTKPDGSSDDKRRKPRLSLGDKPKKQPRIAFTGEEWGFGYQATGKFLERARHDGNVPDAGLASLKVRLEREFAEASTNNSFDYHREVTQPLRTKEQALMAVKQDTADFAVVPFYNPYSGYDFEALRALGTLFTVRGIAQVEATDKLCLAVHESQLFDLIQSSHPGTAFSNLQRRMRNSYGATDAGSGNSPGSDYQPEMPRAGLPLDLADQKLIRDRIDLVFAGPDAARRCKSKLDGLRSIGVDVKEVPLMVEPHRELAKLARETVSSARQTNTIFNAHSGETSFYSTLGAEAQSGKLFGMVLPYEVAMRSSDYSIIDHDFDDAPAPLTRFMVVENNPDHTLFEDRYRTTDAKTAYWVRRMHAVAQPGGTIGAGFMQFLGYILGVASFLLLAFGIYGVGANSMALIDLPQALSGLSMLTSQGAVIAGIAALGLSWVLLSVQSSGARGVRTLLHFRRDGAAASLGDIENFLRNFGVRHTIVRLDEDSNNERPAAIVLDIEFDPKDFSYGPFSMMSRRLRGSVVNGALKLAFQRWKNRGVQVLAAMPFEPEQAQLPKHQQRRWWSEAISNWAADFMETMFIRFSRIVFFYALPAALVMYAVWKFVLKG